MTHPKFDTKKKCVVIRLLLIYYLCDINNKSKMYQKMKEEVYTVESAAVLLNSNIQTVRRLIKEGELKAVKKLNKYFILHSDILEYLKK